MKSAKPTAKPFRFKAKDVVEAYRSRGWRARRLSYGEVRCGGCCLLGIGLAMQMAIKRLSTLEKRCDSLTENYSIQPEAVAKAARIDSGYALAAEAGFMDRYIESESPTPREIQGLRDGQAAWDACVKAGLTEGSP